MSVQQLMRANDRIVILATEQPLRYDAAEAMQAKWQEVTGGDPKLLIFPYTRLVPMEGGRGLIFEFTGEFSPTMIAEFRRWWESEVANGDENPVAGSPEAQA